MRVGVAWLDSVWGCRGWVGRYELVGWVGEGMGRVGDGCGVGARFEGFWMVG